MNYDSILKLYFFMANFLEEIIIQATKSGRVANDWSILLNVLLLCNSPSLYWHYVYISFELKILNCILYQAIQSTSRPNNSYRSCIAGLVLYLCDIVYVKLFRKGHQRIKFHHINRSIQKVYHRHIHFPPYQYIPIFMGEYSTAKFL